MQKHQLPALWVTIPAPWDVEKDSIVIVGALVGAALNDATAEQDLRLALMAAGVCQKRPGDVLNTGDPVRYDAKRAEVTAATTPGGPIIGVALAPAGADDERAEILIGVGGSNGV
jgi:predicted RecA/RadA family phage recombinase